MALKSIELLRALFVEDVEVTEAGLGNTGVIAAFSAEGTKQLRWTHPA